MLSSDDYLGRDALSLCKKLRDKEFTAEELTLCAINRAETVSRTLTPLLQKIMKKALEQAKRFDRKPDLWKPAPPCWLAFFDQRFKHSKRPDSDF